MNLVYRLSWKLIAPLVVAMLIVVVGAVAQTPAGILRGQVMDPSGAAVAGATVVVLPADGVIHAVCLIGHDPTELGVMTGLMDRHLKGHPYVKSPIDMACWDILGKVAGLPLSTAI